MLSKPGESSWWRESSLNWPLLKATLTLTTRLWALRERVKRWQASELSLRMKEPSCVFLRTSSASSLDRSPQYHPHILSWLRM